LWKVRGGRDGLAPCVNGWPQLLKKKKLMRLLTRLTFRGILMIGKKGGSDRGAGHGNWGGKVGGESTGGLLKVKEKTKAREKRKGG